jgi:hypothetical protein
MNLIAIMLSLMCLQDIELDLLAIKICTDVFLPLPLVLLSVSHDQLRSENIKWRIPEVSSL